MKKISVFCFVVAIDSLLCMSPGVSDVDDACRDIDSQACVLMAQRNSGLCQDQVLSRTACPKFCKICPLECYHCEVSVRDYMECNTTTACDVNQQCMLQKLHSSLDGHDEYVMGCASLQLCDGGGLTLSFGRRALHERNVAVTCCDTDRCNLPTESSSVSKPTESIPLSNPTESSTVSKPTESSTVPNTFTDKPTQHLPSCVRDIVLIIEDFGDKTSNQTTHVNPSTHYMTTFLKEFVARLPIGPTGSLLGLALIDSDIHSVWSLIDHVTNDQLQMAINGIRFQHRKDRLDIEN